MWNGKNVLVAGGAGFTGSNLIKRLLSFGVNIRATIHVAEPVIIDDAIEYVKTDLLSMDNCKELVKDMDYVFMCAANTSGAKVIASTPLIHVTPNIIMNTQILEASYFAKVKKFIFPSSSVVYPTSNEKPVKEDEMLSGEPYDVYFGASWMKRFTEILCRLYSEKLKNPMSTVVIRPANIYGPYDDFEPESSHVMAATLRKVIERQDPIQVWGTGDDIRDFIYIDDYIDGMILATEKLDTYNPVNIASGEAYSVKQILQIALEEDNYKKAKIVYDPSKPSMIPMRLFDTKKAESLLGFKAKTDIREGIRKTIKWFREEHDLSR